MYRKLFLFMAILFTFTIFVVGCRKKSASLDYMETPNEMTVKRYNSELTLQVKDTEFINRIMNEVVNLKGTKQGSTIKVPTNNILFIILFPYSIKDMNNSSGNTTYTIQIHILSDGTALMQAFNENSLPNVATIKTLKNNDIIDYIKNFYDSKM